MTWTLFVDRLLAAPTMRWLDSRFRGNDRGGRLAWLPSCPRKRESRGLVPATPG